MNRTLPLALLGLGAMAVVGVAAATLFRPAEGEGRADAAEMTALRAQVEELRREVHELRDRAGAAPAVATNLPAREALPVPDATAPPVNAAPTLSPVNRDAILAVIKEDRDAREREREEQQKKQQRDRTTQRVKSTAERLGIDAATTESLVKLCVSSLDREDDVRKAYPIADLGDPNFEKRRLELQAVWQERDAQVAALLPADKREQWDRQTRWLDRAREFADAFPGGGGGLDFGPRPNRRQGGGGGGGPVQGGSNPAGPQVQQGGQQGEEH
ncbi:MAG TPA: hypothetical protein VKE69_05730 [Planctomycetota bacterium]|nr:hypothetical protein [Planctomycetota bacterium]